VNDCEDHSVLQFVSSTRNDRLFWLTVFLLHLLGAAAWFVLMPGGFPWWHPRFWTNRVLPLMGATFALLAVIAMRARKPAVADAMASAVAIGWLSCALSGRIVFSQSGRLLWLIPLALACVSGLRLIRLRRGKRRVNALAIVMAAIAALAGASMPLRILRIRAR
jgi:hypothetical protein